LSCDKGFFIEIRPKGTSFPSEEHDICVHL